MNKKLLSLFVLITVCTISSCSSDDIDEHLNRTLILGEWKLIRTVENGRVIDSKDCKKMYRIEFQADKDAIVTNEEENGEEICKTVVNIERYSLNGDNVTINNEGTFEVKIGSNLRLISTRSSKTIEKVYDRD